MSTKNLIGGALGRCCVALLLCGAGAAAAQQSLYFTLPTSCRAYDSRSGDGALAAGAARTVVLIGASPCGIPAAAIAVALNVTAVDPTFSGSFAVRKAGSSETLEAVYFRVGRARANNRVVLLGGSGDVDVVASAGSGSVGVVLDVSGYFLSGPILTAGGATATFTEDGGPVAVDPAIVVDDPSDPNLISATVTITNPLDGAGEVLAAVPASCAGLTVTPGANSLIITGSQPFAAYQTCLRSVTYDNSAQNPTVTARTVTFVASDASLTSNTLSETVTIVAQNDAPVLAAGGGSPTFTEGASPVAVDTGLTASDVDNANLASATVTITNPQDAAAEVLAATSCAGLTVTPGLNSLSITGSQPVSTYQACLRSVTYENTSQNPTELPARLISFKVNDGTLDSNTVTTTVNVVAVDDPPVAVADAATVTEDDPATAVDVLANDTDVDAGPKSVASVTQPANGVVVITGGGTGLTYQPNADYCNTPPGTTLDTFTYTLTPGSSTATVTMTVTCVDDPPVAVADAATVTEDDPATAINVLANDTDVDGGPKSVASVTQPANGTVVITGGGTGLTYQPNANYCNTPPGTTPDTFTYTLTPGSSTATVSVAVTCVDDAPVAVNDSATVNEDSGANAINVLANDTDIDGGPQSVSSVTQPANGAVIITGGGTGLTYQPNANYCNNPPGTTLDTFTYTLTPGGSTATVTMTVTCVDDSPVAVDDGAALLEDGGATAVDVLANDTDIDGGPKSVSSVTQPANGVVVITGGGTGLTYNPALNYCNASFTNASLFRLGEDDPGAVAAATANDPTKDSSGSDDLARFGAPTYSSSVQVGIGSTLSVHFNGTSDYFTNSAANPTTAIDDFGVDLWVKSDVAGGADALIFHNGKTSTDGWGIWRFGGQYQAVYTASGSFGATPVTTAWTHLVLIRRGGVSSFYVNGTRVATSALVPTTPTTGTGAGTTLGGNLSGADFAGLIDEVRVFTISDPPSGGTPDTFTYTLSPGGSTATVSATVECVVDSPVAVDDSATVTEDDPATTIDVRANDSNPDAATFTIQSVTQPANGTVVVTNSGADLTYQPAANYCNTPPGTTLDTFTYTLTPGGSTATVSMSVTCVDDPPVAVNDSATVTEDDPATAINVLANDTDIDGGPKSIASVTQPGNGVVVITGGGTGLTYKPNANYCNSAGGPSGTPDTFTYTLTPASATPTATVSMTVICVNDAPTPIGSPKETFDTIGNTQFQFAASQTIDPGVFVSGNLVANFTDVDGPSISAVPIVNGATANGGVVNLAASGEFVFTPKAGDTAAADTFQYQVTDTIATTAPRTVTINLKNRVWYVKNNAAAGGLGRSQDPFDTLVEAQSASLAGDYIFVYRGDGTNTGQANGITLKDQQHFLGEGAGLSIPVATNGNPSPTVLVTPGSSPCGAGPCEPVVDNTDAITIVASPAVGTATLPAEIVGFSLGNSVSGTPVPASVISLIQAGTGYGISGSCAIRNNIFRQATGDSMHLYPGGSGPAVTQTFTITGNSWVGGSFVGDGIALLPQSATAKVVADVSNNTNLQTTTSVKAGMRLDAISAGLLTITGFANNTVNGNSAGTGITSLFATFDATPGSPFQTVSGGTTVIGALGNGVGQTGMLLSNASGDLSFTDLDIYADAGAGLFATGTTPYTGSAGLQITVGAGVSTIAAVGGPAVSLSTVKANLPFQQITSTNSATTGVALNSVLGTFSAGSGSSISGSTGTGFQVGSSNATISYAGTINVTSGKGVDLTTNTGSTIDFTGTMTLSSGSNTAFNATGGGTVTATDTASTLTTTTGTALNVANTTIGASGLKFKSITAGTAASGPTNGIVLNTTGTTGALTVAGTGSAGTGGTIQKTGAECILITGPADASFSWMSIQNPGTHGISGTTVRNLTVANTTITDAAGAVISDDGIHAINTTGTLTITNTTINGARHQGVTVDNNNTSMAGLSMTGSTITNTPGGDGMLIQMRGTSVMTSGTISSNTFSSNSATGLQVSNIDTGNIASLTIQSNTISSNNAGIDLDVGPPGASLTATVQSNTITGSHTQALNMVTATTNTGGSFTATLRTNNIGTAGVVDSGSAIGNGIRVANGGVTVALTIDGNVIREVPNGRGIDIEAQAYTPNLNLKAKIINNQIIRPTGTNQNIGCGANVPCPSASLFVLSDSNGLGGFDHVCTVITGNSAYDPTSWPAGGEAAYYFARRTSASNTLSLEGTQANVTSQILATNAVTNLTSAGVFDENTSGTVAIVPAGTCGGFPP